MGSHRVTVEPYVTGWESPRTAYLGSDAAQAWRSYLSQSALARLRGHGDRVLLMSYDPDLCGIGGWTRVAHWPGVPRDGEALGCDCPCHDPAPKDSSHEPAACVCGEA